MRNILEVDNFRLVQQGDSAGSPRGAIAYLLKAFTIAVHGANNLRKERDALCSVSRFKAILKAILGAVFRDGFSDADMVVKKAVKVVELR